MVSRDFAVTVACTERARVWCVDGAYIWRCGRADVSVTKRVYAASYRLRKAAVFTAVSARRYYAALMLYRPVKMT